MYLYKAYLYKFGIIFISCLLRFWILIFPFIIVFYKHFYISLYWKIMIFFLMVVLDIPLYYVNWTNDFFLMLTLQCCNGFFLYKPLTVMDCDFFVRMSSYKWLCWIKSCTLWLSGGCPQIYSYSVWEYWFHHTVVSQHL